MMNMGRHPYRMGRAPRRDVRRTMAGTGDPSRLRSTANFRQKCSGVPHLEREECGNLQRFRLGRASLDNNLPQPATAVSGLSYQDRRCICQFSRQSARGGSLSGQSGDTLRSTQRQSRSILSRCQAIQNRPARPAMQRRRTRVGYDGTAITWHPEPDEVST